MGFVNYFLLLFLFSTLGLQSIVIFMSVSVCPLAYLRNDMSKLHESVHITCDHGSVLLRRQFNTLCTSSFVDVVMFSHNDTNTGTGHWQIIYSDS